MKTKKKNPGVINNPDDAYDLLKIYHKAEQEHFIVITLDKDRISISIVAIGNYNSTHAHAREIFVRAIRDMADSVIICHNHPSGMIMPSVGDINYTKNMFEAGKILGINVIDHLIFNQYGYASSRRDGYYETFEF